VEVHAICVQQLYGDQLIFSSLLLNHFIKKIKLIVKKIVPTIYTKW